MTTDRDLITEGRAALKANATFGVVKLGQWARANLGALLDALEAKHTQHAETLGYLEHAYEVIEAQRPYSRVVTSPPELDALPDGAILRTRLGHAAILTTVPKYGRGAYMTNFDGVRCLGEGDFPAEVLWLPPAVVTATEVTE